MNYWLVFDYHTNGSLASYIKETVLTKNEVLLFLSSIASGLGYLHRSIPTSTDDSKPMLAHRDLKPSNILIKDDMQCCIGDLGLAVTEKDFVEGKEFPDPFVGTKRYMAPEILGGTIRKKNIESYVRADVYSFALIMWEVCRRCQWHGKGEGVGRGGLICWGEGGGGTRYVGRGVGGGGGTRYVGGGGTRYVGRGGRGGGGMPELSIALAGFSPEEIVKIPHQRNINILCGTLSLF